MQTKKYSINGTFARNNNIPASFIAVSLIETPKAQYVYGHGAVDPAGSCAKCGKPLTHPGSIILGIGPVCLGNWGARDVVLDNLTESDKTRLQGLITDRAIDCWIPKSVIKMTYDTTENIPLPKEHKMMKPKSPM